MDAITPYLAVLLPSVGIFFIFFFVYRSIIRADRSEREAYREAVEEYLAKNPQAADSRSLRDDSDASK